MTFIVTYGPAVVAWVFAILGSVGTFVIAHMGWSSYVQGILHRAWVEIQGAVLEVEQTYVSTIKQASSDGALTESEKQAAKLKALDAIKANLGRKGLERLERVLGVDVEQWLASKTEQAVAVMRQASPPFVPAPQAIPLPPVPA